MIDTKSLYPFRNKLRDYDKSEKLLLDLNNYVYAFLNQSPVPYAWVDFGESVWVHLLMRPLQEKDCPTSFIFSILQEIYANKDVAHLYAYIELLYDTLSSSSKTFPILFSNLADDFETGINDILSRFDTGLTFCSGFIIKGLDSLTKKEIETALEENDTASKNIQSALQAISIRGQEDADLCIREATCAIEVTIRTRLNVKHLSDGIKKLRNPNKITIKQSIHPALLNSLENFYGYSSDNARHGATKPISIDEAHLALALSAAWVNFLRKTLPEPRVNENQ